MVSFRKSFRPTKKDKIRSYEKLVELHRKYTGRCCTCKYLIPSSPSYLQSFITDYGKCALNQDIFSIKVCGLKDVECDCYEENVGEINNYLSIIEKLKET